MTISEQAQLLEASAQVDQPDAYAYQPYWALTAGEGASKKIGIILQLETGTGLFKSGLGEIVEFELDEGFAGTVSAIEPRHPSGEFIKQFWQSLQAGREIR